MAPAWLLYHDSQHEATLALRLAGLRQPQGQVAVNLERFGHITDRQPNSTASGVQRKSSTYF